MYVCAYDCAGFMNTEVKAKQELASERAERELRASLESLDYDKHLPPPGSRAFEATLQVQSGHRRRPVFNTLASDPLGINTTRHAPGHRRRSPNHTRGARRTRTPSIPLVHSHSLLPLSRLSVSLCISGLPDFSIKMPAQVHT